MKKYTIKIEHDDDPMNPRTDWDNVTTMICFHNRYNLGDKHDYKSDNFDGLAELKEQIESDYKVLWIKPLFLYDHSGITISTQPFSCRWDSGQVGWVFIDEKQLNLMCGKDFERDEIKLSEMIDADVETYDKYITGEVYRYSIYEIETCSLGHEHKNYVEGCGGYYSEEEAESEANAVLRSLQVEVVQVTYRLRKGEGVERKFDPFLFYHHKYDLPHVRRNVVWQNRYYNAAVKFFPARLNSDIVWQNREEIEAQGNILFGKTGITNCQTISPRSQGVKFL